MEITKEEFHKAISGLATKDDVNELKTDIAGIKKVVVTKSDLDEALGATERRLMKHAESLQEELARMVAHQVVKDLDDKLDMVVRVKSLENQVGEIRSALHLNPNV